MRKFVNLLVLMCIGAMFMTAFLPAVTADVGALATGREKTMSVEVTGLGYVQSNGTLALKVHVFNISAGDLQGAKIIYNSTGLGTFVPVSGITDIQGANSTVFHAPKNSAAQVLKVPIAFTANLTGYTNATTVFNVDVYPETHGVPMSFNQSITHLVYVTTYDQGSSYLDGSSVHSGIDFLANVQAVVNGKSVTVANYSNWEKADQTFVLTSQTHHITSDLKGYYYYDPAVKVTVYSHVNKTTRTHVYDASHSTWTNTTEVTTTTYLPAMMGYNASLDQVGLVQEFVNTYMVTMSTWNIDTGAKTTFTGLQTATKRFTFVEAGDVTNFMGEFPTYVFVDNSAVFRDAYSPALGVLLQEQEYNATGHLASTKVLTEYNTKVGEDPTSPSLTVTISVDNPAPLAGTRTTAHVVVTAGTAHVQGVTVTATIGQGGSLAPARGTTDKDGKLDLVFTADSGIATTDVPVTVTAKKTGYQTGQAMLTITVVQDTAAPVLHHIPTTHIGEGVSLTISTNVVDDAGVSEVDLYYRIDVSLKFKPVKMEMHMGSYVASIPAGILKPPRMEYFLEASDINGNVADIPAGAPDDAYYDVFVEPVIKVLPPVTTTLGVGGNATVTGAVTGDLTLSISKVDNPDKGPSDARFMGLFAEIKGVGSGQPVWANISFTYTDALLGHLNETGLRIYWWDPLGLTWTTVDDTGVRADKNVVWANVTHLTIFAPRAQDMPVIPPPADTTLPTASLDIPLDKAQLSQGTVQLKGMAADNVGLYSVQYKLDSGGWVDVSVPAGTKATSWTATVSLSSGDHTISVRAKDTTGNVGQVTTVHVTVLKEKPSEGITTQALMTVVAALLIVIAVIVVLYLVNRTPEKKETGGAIKKGEEEDEEKGGEEE
jgi:hypothetical protein